MDLQKFKNKINSNVTEACEVTGHTDGKGSRAHCREQKESHVRECLLETCTALLRFTNTAHIVLALLFNTVKGLYILFLMSLCLVVLLCIAWDLIHRSGLVK